MRLHNRRMKISPRFFIRAHPVRNLCLTATGSLFLFSVGELVVGTGGNVGVWCGLALVSAYLGICLMQRRQYFPSSRWAIKPRRYSQFVD
jgi:hypothetical protein